MEVKLNVEGLMCPKCEARVKKALEALTGVESAVADRTTGTAVIKGEGLDTAVLKAAVEEAGYKVTG